MKELSDFNTADIKIKCYEKGAINCMPFLMDIFYCDKCKTGTLEVMPWLITSNHPRLQYYCNNCDNIVYSVLGFPYNQTFSQKETPMKNAKKPKPATKAIKSSKMTSVIKAKKSAKSNWDMPIVNRLVMIRKELGMSRADVAKKMNRAAQQIHVIENSKSTPRFDTINKYAKALGYKAIITLIPVSAA